MIQKPPSSSPPPGRPEEDEKRSHLPSVETGTGEKHQQRHKPGTRHEHHQRPKALISPAIVSEVQQSLFFHDSVSATAISRSAFANAQQTAQQLGISSSGGGRLYPIGETTAAHITGEEDDGGDSKSAVRKDSFYESSSSSSHTLVWTPSASPASSRGSSPMASSSYHSIIRSFQDKTEQLTRISSGGNSGFSRDPASAEQEANGRSPHNPGGISSSNLLQVPVRRGSNKKRRSKGSSGSKSAVDRRISTDSGVGGSSGVTSSSECSSPDSGVNFRCYDGASSGADLGGGASAARATPSVVSSVGDSAVWEGSGKSLQL